MKAEGKGETETGRGRKRGRERRERKKTGKQDEEYRGGEGNNQGDEGGFNGDMKRYRRE